jgi:hypothetical protein
MSFTFNSEETSSRGFHRAMRAFLKSHHERLSQNSNKVQDILRTQILINRLDVDG